MSHNKDKKESSTDNGQINLDELSAEFEPAEQENSPAVIIEEAGEVDAQGNAPAIDTEPLEEEHADEGGLFSRLLKSRQERKEAVGDDDEYSIFDLQELLDIPADEDLPEAAPAPEHPFAEDEDDVFDEDEDDENGRGGIRHRATSLLARFKHSKTESDNEEADEPTEIAEPSEPIEAPEPVEEEQSEPSEGEAAESKAEVEEEPYVSPLEAVRNSEVEKFAALREINKTLFASGMGQIDIPKEKKEGQSIEDSIDDLFEREIKGGAANSKRAEPKTRLATAKNDKFTVMRENENDGMNQIQMEDYAAESIEPQMVNEAEEERKLEQKRKPFVEKFRINIKENAVQEDEAPEGSTDLSQDLEIMDGETVFDAVERTPGGKKSFVEVLKARMIKQQDEQELLTAAQIKKQLGNDRKRTNFIIIAEGALALIALVLAAVAVGVTGKDDAALTGIFAAGARVYVLINLIIYAVGAAIALPVFKKAFARIKSGFIDSRAVFLCMNAAVAAQLILALCAGLNANGGFVVYTLVGLVAILGEAVATRINIDTIGRSLLVLTKHKLRGIKAVESKEESGKIGYDLAADGEPSIYYTADVRLPENIAYLNENTAKEQRASRLHIIISAAVGLALSVAVCIIKRSAMPLVTVLPCALCLALPAMRPLVLSLFKADANKGSILNGVGVLSYDECDEITRANAVVLDTNELLGVTVSQFRKAPGAGMTKNDAAFYTAAVLKKSGSMLSSCFDGFVKEFSQSTGIDLPDAEEFHIENSAFFAVVDGARVLIGTRKAVEDRNIPCPTAEQEAAYAGDCFVLYTCVNDKIVATFKASYAPRRTAKEQINALRRSGIVIMLSCVEPSLGEDEVAALLHCTPAMTKVISRDAIAIIDKNRAKESDERSNGIFAVKSKRTVLLAVAAAYNLSIRRRTTKAATFALSIVLLAVYALAAVFNLASAFSPITVVILNALAGAVTFLIGRMSGRK